MARRSKAVIPEWEDYTPRWDGNDDAIDDDQVVVEIRGMPQKIMASWQNLAQTTQPMDASMLDKEYRSQAVERIKEDMVSDADIADLAGMSSHPKQIELVMRHCVRNVRNYEDAKGRPIRSGDDLLRAGEAELINEVYWSAMGKSIVARSAAKN